ncbi:MAG: hypothetical protein QME42_01585 [bacterium]|nr:hypothetical protein [bacterium]
MDFSKRDELAERLLDFTIRIIKLVNALSKTVVRKTYQFKMINAKFAICNGVFCLYPQ